MKKLTFQTQFRLLVIFFILCFIACTITKQGIFNNIAWIVYGAAFLINPVWPAAWDYADHQKLTLGCRVGGILAIVIGLITRFYP